MFPTVPYGYYIIRYLDREEEEFEFQTLNAWHVKAFSYLAGCRLIWAAAIPDTAQS